MLKRIITGLFTLGFIAATFPTLPVSADPVAPIEIDNILDLCLYAHSNGHWFNNANDCSIYTSTQTSVIMDNRPLEINDPVILNNLDITFVLSNLQIYLKGNGSLTINGGHYTSPSCVLWMMYNNRKTPAAFDRRITINSGIFTATSTNTTSDIPASPVCLNATDAIEPELAETLINDYLPDGKIFQEVSQTRQTLHIAKGTAHTSKDSSQIDDIYYLDVHSVAVVDAPTNLEPTPTEPEEPTPAPEPESPLLPKAPNTGRK